MRIYIPSLSRSGDIGRGPLHELPPHVLGGRALSYVVPVEQAEEYTQALSREKRQDVSVLPCPERGIAATRLWIGEHARMHDQSKFLMLDDDIGFLVRRSPDTWKLRNPQPLEIMRLLNEVEMQLDDNEHVGVSAREGNNNPGTGGVDLVVRNTRTIRALAFQTHAFLSVEHGRVDVMEDFDVSLQILRNGGSNLSLFYWAQGQSMTNAPGGCSTYRDHELHEKSAKRLSELHPGCVKLVEKRNKTDADGFGTRTEVRIQWKKAWKQGRQATEGTN